MSLPPSETVARLLAETADRKDSPGVVVPPDRTCRREIFYIYIKREETGGIWSLPPKKETMPFTADTADGKQPPMAVVAVPPSKGEIVER